MKDIIRETAISFQFLYPCIAYGELSEDGKELIITAETKLENLYPILPSVAGMIHAGEDYWSRPLFKDANDIFYCEVDGGLFYKGRDSEGEPQYREKDKEIVYSSPNVDPELSALEPYIELAKEFIKSKTNMTLIEVTKTVTPNPYDEDKSIINCFYRMKLP